MNERERVGGGEKGRAIKDETNVGDKLGGGEREAFRGVKKAFRVKVRCSEGVFIKEFNMIKAQKK
ncbi:unnamed protein product [Pneumocystis jirovecii]|uniref:Uncharacterized protein n=1 Tax=Pneumocystis jirovecii TaxID=42068 RepID=L0PEV1_PNEJI|nr:unnamed protein product [Pneumocystis jirovecii]